MGSKGGHVLPLKRGFALIRMRQHSGPECSEIEYALEIVEESTQRASTTSYWSLTITTFHRRSAKENCSKGQFEGRRTKTRGFKAKAVTYIAFSSKNSGRIAAQKNPVRRS